MIPLIDNMTPIYFVYWDTGGGGTPIYGTVSIAGYSTVDGSLIGYGRLSGSVDTYSTTSAIGRAIGRLSGTINTFSTVSAYWKAIARMFGTSSGSSSVSAKWRAVAKISGTINTFSTVVGDMNKKLIIEILRFTSKVTKFIKFK